MLIQLKDGHEPLHVETQHICSIEGINGGNECHVRTVDGAVHRVRLTPAEIIRRMADSVMLAQRMQNAAEADAILKRQRRG